MTHPARCQELAKEGIRLLRQQDPEMLGPIWKTTLGELQDALDWLNSITPKAPPVALEMDGEERSFAAKFQAILRKQLQDAGDYLTNGKAKDFADYKRVVGIIAGLRKALETYGELLTADIEN